MASGAGPRSASTPATTVRTMTFANAMVVTLAMALIVLRIGISPGACCAQCEEGTKNGIDYAKVATEYIGSGTILYCNNTA